MRVLLTNAEEEQAWLIVRALRPAAARIAIAGTAGHGRSVASCSAMVDSRHTLSDPSDNWRRGILSRENSPAEEKYIAEVEDICAREGLDTVFPSLDAHVFVLSKNKERLARRAITVVAPDHDRLADALDKSRTIAVARRAGFPHPKTHLPQSTADIARIAARTAPPWVVKPRCSAHGASARLARNEAELEREFARITEFQAGPVVQEFIPGRQPHNAYVVVDRNMDIVAALACRVVRTRVRGLRVSLYRCVSIPAEPRLESLRRLVAELGVWGCLTIQAKIDPRDGEAKLMEVNARPGTNLWFRTELGVNEPQLFVDIAHGRTPAGDHAYPADVMLLNPVADLRDITACATETVAGWARSLTGAPRRDQSMFEPDRLYPLVRDTLASYRPGRRKAYWPFLTGMFRDPRPCLRQCRADLFRPRAG